MQTRIVSSEIASLFIGMTCSFVEIPDTCFRVEEYFRTDELVVKARAIVETYNGERAVMVDCTPVYNSSSTPRWAETHYFTDQDIEDALDNDEIGFCCDRQAYYFSDYCVTTEDGETEHIEDCVRVNYEWYLQSSDAICCDGHGIYFLDGDSDYVYCDDGDYWPVDECHYCEEGHAYYHEDEEDCEYCNPQDRDGCVCRYHHSPAATIYRGMSGFAVGFEVEKVSANGADSEGDYVGEHPLFSGWETDASCGIEGITHAYDPIDLNTAAQFRDDLRASRGVVDAPWDSTCGGHINISSENHAPRELMSAFKTYAPLWYAVYRNRLNNNYCNNDKKIDHGSERYSPVRTKSFGIEVRLPSAVKNAEVLLRRFEWTGLTCIAIRDRVSFNSYVKSCRELLLNGAYGGNRDKYAKIVRLARDFRVWMLDGIAKESIQQWIA